jgi:hypothetical protein
MSYALRARASSGWRWRCGGSDVAAGIAAADWYGKRMASVWQSYRQRMDGVPHPLPRRAGGLRRQTRPV